VSGLLTETADYDTPGSWGTASNGWPEIHGDAAYDMYVFANCVETAPYGSYVLMGQKGHYGATESCLRVHSQHVERLKQDFNHAGRPNSNQSVQRRETFGTLNEWGNRKRAPLWKA
jgi:hypothetical protein